MEKVFIATQMGEFIKALLKTTKCMGKVYTHGLMEENTQVLMRMTKNKDMVAITGQMEDTMKDNGEMGKEMGMERSCIKMVSLNMGFGMTIRKCNKQPRKASRQ